MLCIFKGLLQYCKTSKLYLHLNVARYSFSTSQDSMVVMLGLLMTKGSWYQHNVASKAKIGRNSRAHDLFETESEGGQAQAVRVY
jgi:hypothetical protein